MTTTSRDDWTFGAQIATATGMFLVTLGILSIAPRDRRPKPVDFRVIPV